MDKVEVEILGLSSSPSAGGAYALLLKEVYGSRRLPIIIGAYEAQAIALELEGIKPPRPLTHDLIKSLIDNLGVSVKEVIINELRDNTFYAKILLDVSSLTNEVDARPSDAIAVAVRTGSSIYVSETVMQVAAFVPSSQEIKNSADEDIEKNYQIEKQTTKYGTKESRIATLQDQLRIAIEKEDYERAAKLRDEINRLKGSN